MAYDRGDNLSPEEKINTLYIREGPYLLFINLTSSSDNPPPGVLELLHFHGTESNPSFPGYVSGNSPLTGLGFGHIAITVDDVYKVCEWFEKLGITFMQRPGGEFGDVASILDPDG